MLKDRLLPCCHSSDNDVPYDPKMFGHTPGNPTLHGTEMAIS